jgi:HlyD family secretion protein
MSKSRSRFVWVVAVVVVGLALWSLLRQEAPAVEIARVERGPVRVTIDEEGETRVRDRYVVDSPVTARLRRIALREGDTVEAGGVVAQLDPAPLDAREQEEGEARLEAALDGERVARAALERAKAARDQAERERERAIKLAQDGLVSSEASERADLAAQTARKELEAMEYRAKAAAHEVEMARAAIAPRLDGGVVVVKAPARGRVLRVNEPSERVVLAGTALVEIGDPGDLEVVVDLLSSDAVRVAIGDTIEIGEWGGDATLKGVVRLVEPSAFTKVSALGVDEQRVNVVAVVNDSPSSLGDRFRVAVSIVLWQAPGVVRIPRGAVFRSGDGWATFVLEEGRVTRRELAIGHQGGEHFEVLGGVSAGEAVVMYPDERIHDGVRTRGREHASPNEKALR